MNLREAADDLVLVSTLAFIAYEHQETGYS